MNRSNLYTISTDGQVVYTKLSGQWDDNTSKNYLDDVKSECELVSDKPWALIVDMTEWKFVSPEGLEVGNEFNNSEFDRSNQEIEIWICTRSFYKIVLSRVTHLPEDTIFKVFPTMDEAKEYLRNSKFNPVS